MNSQDVLNRIAKMAGARVSNCLVYDPNVCDFEPAPANFARIITKKGQPFRRKTSYINDQLKIRLHANDDFLKIQVLFDSDLDPISINRRNETVFLKLADQMTLHHRKHQLFTYNGTLSARHKNLIRDPHFRRFIEALNTSSEESVHFTRGDLTIYLWQPRIERALQIIDASLAFLKTLTPLKEAVDFNILPLQFKPLISLILTWGHTDDAERSELREHASRSTLEAVVTEVKPHLPAIDAYLDSLRDWPMPEAATLLGALAEFAVETELQLKKSR